MTTNEPTLHEDRRPDSPAWRVDVACDHFESAWRAGEGPRIEDCLAAAAEPERPALLRELIALEAELRRGRGERPAPAEYHGRLPGQAATVDAAFTETAPGPGRSPRRSSQARLDTGRNLLFGGGSATGTRQGFGRSSTRRCWPSCTRRTRLTGRGR